MSVITEEFANIARLHPAYKAYRTSRNETLTFGELDQLSNAIAVHLAGALPRQTPVALYGHKSPYMLACMVGCMRAGMAYVPLDTSFPEGRCLDILDQLHNPLLISTEPQLPFEAPVPLMALEELTTIAHAEAAPVDPELAITGTEVMYVLFTSGSTGRPKGVEQSAGSLDAFCAYYKKFDFDEPNVTFFNRTPFSFDASLLDLVVALSCGHETFALEREAESSVAKTFEALASSNSAMWVSTPSFAEICLADKSFGAEMMPSLKKMILAGEVLKNSTALKLLDAFPGLELYNGYGPTETEAVTDVLVDRHMAETVCPLPIGYAGPGIRIEILDRETLEPVAAGEEGEICVFGKTLANSYYGRQDLTDKAFITLERNGVQERCYRTGDKGHMDEDGCVHYQGRFDLQVKLNGYRIEIGEIEERLSALPEVAANCVIAHTKADTGKVDYLCAFVVLSDGQEGNFAKTKELKAALSEPLPQYMIPRKFKYVEELPTNVNGKTDRKALALLA